MDYTTIRQNFESHGFTTQLFSTGQEVCDYLAKKLERRTIGFGGSVTLKEIGLYEALSEKNVVVWHNKIMSRDVRRLANLTSIYITSANAISETGEIVNIDGTGNRVAMTAFGPRECYYIVGKNKITPDLVSALDRAKNVAGPKNAQRAKSKTPCARLGDKCYNCNTPERVCRMTIFFDRPPFGMPTEIIFVDQDLGF